MPEIISCPVNWWKRKLHISFKSQFLQFMVLYCFQYSPKSPTNSLKKGWPRTYTDHTISGMIGSLKWQLVIQPLMMDIIPHLPIKSFSAEKWPISKYENAHYSGSHLGLSCLIRARISSVWAFINYTCGFNNKRYSLIVVKLNPLNRQNVIHSQTCVGGLGPDSL